MIKYNGLECVLLIDDDTPTNYLHKLAIEKAGVDVHIQVATTAMEALQFLSRTGAFDAEGLPQPGIIFLDINMPAMDGWEFMEEYKKLSAAQKARIIVFMLTTSLNPADMERAMSIEEVVTFLNKPLTSEKVNELVAAYYKQDQ
jgi:CheY-like chemotaxis protein